MADIQVAVTVCGPAVGLATPAQLETSQTVSSTELPCVPRLLPLGVHGFYNLE